MPVPRSGRRPPGRYESPPREDSRSNKPREQPSEDKRSKSRSKSPGYHRQNRSQPIRERDYRPTSSGKGEKDREKRQQSNSSEEDRGRRLDRKCDDDGKQQNDVASQESELDEDEMMRQMMGFSNFDTTKEKKIPGKDVSGVAKVKSSGFRQYMNRTRGFNRELSPPPEEKKK